MLGSSDRRAVVVSCLRPRRVGLRSDAFCLHVEAVIRGDVAGLNSIGHRNGNLGAAIRLCRRGVKSEEMELERELVMA